LFSGIVLVLGTSRAKTANLQGSTPHQLAHTENAMGIATALQTSTAKENE